MPDTSTARQRSHIRPGDNLAKIRLALMIFRVMAIIAGIALLVLCVELFVHYGLHSEAMEWWPQIHGFLFIAFVLSVFNLGFKLRWGIIQMGLYVLTAFVPVLSFVLEHRVNATVSAQLQAASAETGQAQ
ncbi:DUF3817 domain-containing protein [Leekyejoonella antrihumi]|uniref:DUF3817 domain-containing protein n=1 Tax=Leekyejoonella antrihumi TaxID=1660198 RepID=A0A563E174_9MICO|nr:DUF3817 domain-containing protein [Leekyejoonella antrihumi]TWP35983.1 DUF3817 domain-containing protein [Leekyejoonella antrihumi]